jgi:hypothetical protein
MVAEVVTFPEAIPGPTLLLDSITRAGSQQQKTRKLNINHLFVAGEHKIFAQSQQFKPTN